jgi:hypothetical protein
MDALMPSEAASMAPLRLMIVSVILVISASMSPRISGNSTARTSPVPSKSSSDIAMATTEKRDEIDPGRRSPGLDQFLPHDPAPRFLNDRVSPLRKLGN